MKALLSIHYIYWLVLSGVFFAIGEFMSKKFALNPKISFVLLMLASYILGSLAWLPAILQKNQLSIVGVMWSVLSVISTILIGVLIFNEKLSQFGVIGIALGIISVILLSI
jgi:multidrug transporter EmrE-like cation transporter